jgi:Zn-dependent M28 family amino/carboxypeptidase
MKRTSRTILAAVVAVILIVSIIWLTKNNQAVTSAGFNGDRAYADVKAQVDLGPRTPGSPAHQAAIEYFQTELRKAGWSVELQEMEYGGHPVKNVIAKRGSGSWLILGAHYDSRLAADQDPDPANHSAPVPAANDGASGIAVLLELARSLPADLNQEIWLAFFDVEDQGNLPGWDWILGSTALAESLPETNLPEAVIILDMIGDADLNIYMERNSDGDLTREIWNTAAELGYAKSFIPEYKFAMLDDHTPFLRRGIRAVDLIDFDYRYWHTTQDTLDKVSAESLNIVGDTLYQWITTR